MSNNLLPQKKKPEKSSPFSEKETAMKRRKNKRDGKPRRIRRRENEN